ncbi:nuclear pore complex protein NUP1 [Gastrolobium bilobum]|uniref:nuclear pore complex protein NUP1 n=1 Tax=Gastrolobium bilobum TaxID=150636 RepID=UPI002AB27F0F|nr:nuclear pore complex protein NUP1 [Gastrolobium bilobum]
MDTDQITGLTSRSPEAQENRGAGGKLIKPQPRKPPASPYARPPEAVRRRWISKLVDPAYRFIAGGATRILPSFFYTAAPASAPTSDSSTADDQGKRRTSKQGLKDDSCKRDLHLLASESIRMATGDISDKLKSSSDYVLPRQDEKGEQYEKNRLSDVEQLVKGKKLSRDEYNRLVEVLNSRAIDLSNVEEGKENTNLTSRRDDEGLAMTPGLSKISNEQRHDESNGAIWGSSTPLSLSKVRDEIGASPIEIARAYMDSRASEAGSCSKSMIQTVESRVLYGDEAAIKPLPKNSSTCWPGAVVQDTYITPQSHRSGYGLHNFPRTPYSRTLLTKSKFIHMEGDYSQVSSTPLRQSQTTLYQQDKSKVGASESGYGSVGPIRQIRHKVGVQSSRRPPYSALTGTSHRESHGVIEGFTPTVTRSTNHDDPNCTREPQDFELGAPTVHMHSSLMAKKILEHIDRNVPTPKAKSTELKLATKWKYPESSVNFSTVLSNEDNALLKIKDGGPYIYDGNDGKKSMLTNEGKGNIHVDIQPRECTDKSINVRKEGTLASDMNVCHGIPRLSNDARATQSFGGSQSFLMKSTEEDALKTFPSGCHPCVVNQEKKPLSNSAASKTGLPPIIIKKPESRWTLAYDNGSGFTFPVSASSSVFSEPPTPSIMPLFSTGDQHQLKESSTELSFSFGLRKSSAAIVFSFPSTSNTVIHNDAGDIKFNFGSTEKARLSFLFGEDAVCC